MGELAWSGRPRANRPGNRHQVWWQRPGRLPAGFHRCRGSGPWRRVNQCELAGPPGTGNRLRRPVRHRRAERAAVNAISIWGGGRRIRANRTQRGFRRSRPPDYGHREGRHLLPERKQDVYHQRLCGIDDRGFRHRRPFQRLQGNQRFPGAERFPRTNHQPDARKVGDAQFHHR